MDNTKKSINISIDETLLDWIKEQANNDYLTVSTWLNQLLNRMRDEKEGK